MSEVRVLDAESDAVQTHLTILQGIIQRMADNSRSCKLWCITTRRRDHGFGSSNRGAKACADSLDTGCAFSRPRLLLPCTGASVSQVLLHIC